VANEELCVYSRPRLLPRTASQDFLFGREVRGNWVTADLVRSSDKQLLLGVMDGPVASGDVRAARSRNHRRAQRVSREYQTAVTERLVIVVAHSERPEPEWSAIKAAIESDET
jgi:hypothetical protein